MWLTIIWNSFFPKNKIIFTGNPIRQDVLEFASKKQLGISHFNLEENKKTVLVIGGSLGARTINEAIDENISFFVENNLNLIWQTGISYQKKAEKKRKRKSSKGNKRIYFYKRNG